MKIHENPLVLLEFPFSRPRKSLRPKKSLVWGVKSQSCEIPMFLNLAPCRKSKFKKKNHVPCCLNPPIKNTCASSCLFKTRKKKNGQSHSKNVVPICPFFLCNFRFSSQMCARINRRLRKKHTLDSHFLTIFLWAATTRNTIPTKHQKIRKRITH